MLSNPISRSLLSTQRIVKLICFVIFLTTFPLGNKVVAAVSNVGEKEESSTVVEKEAKVGFALNGGGYIAAAGAAAILRGFQQQTIEVEGKEIPSLDAVDLMTCSSGGCLTTVIYHYSQTRSTAEILDGDYRIYNPSQITPKALRRENRKSIFYYLTKNVTFKLVPLWFYEALLRNNSKSVWSLLMWWSILKPFGVKRNQHFGPKSRKNETSTIVPRDEVKSTPFIISMVAGFAEDNGDSFNSTFFGAMMSDIKSTNSYLTRSVSSPSEIAKIFAKNNNTMPFGLTFSPEKVETGFSLDMQTEFGLLTPPKEAEKPWEFGDSKENRFSLETVLGASTNILGFLGLTNFYVQREVKFGNVKKNMALGDQGPLGDPGIAQLVQNGARRIIAPYWYTDNWNQYSLVYERTKDKNLTDWIFDHTGDASDFDGYKAGLVSYFGYGLQGAWNHIFHDGELHMQTLREAFDALHLADKPLIYTIKDVKVIDNAFRGIEGGGVVDITFWHITMPKKFSRQVPRQSVPPPKGVTEIVDEYGRFTNEEFKNFPNILTLGEVPNPYKDGILNKVFFAKKAFLLTTRQANMMSYLGSWLVNEAWEGTYIDGKQYFGGFKKLLE